MAEKERPVWVWLPGEATPTRCAVFTWKPGLGRFRYLDDYKAGGGAIPLDPINLPFSHKTRPETTTAMNGVFGVLRDAAPEGFGLELLIEIHGLGGLDEIERMDLSAGDGVGAIEVCADEQLERKAGYTPSAEDDLVRHIEQSGPDLSAKSTVKQFAGGDDSISLGGEKPKLTVAGAVDGPESWWIAKLQPKGGAPRTPAREYVAMTLAARCDIDVAEVRYRRAGLHEIVFVRRFDRIVAGSRVERRLFASAATALRLKADTTPEDPSRSYVSLASELGRWAGGHAGPAIDQKRELWRRMAFNVLVGNGDDHPRNHGLLFKDGRWSLSPAYDIVAMPDRRGVQAMDLNRGRVPDIGARFATPDALLLDCASFGYGGEEAWATLQTMARTVNDGWRELYAADCGMGEADLEVQRRAFEVAEKVATGQLTPGARTLA